MAKSQLTKAMDKMERSQNMPGGDGGGPPGGQGRGQGPGGGRRDGSGQGKGAFRRNRIRRRGASGSRVSGLAKACPEIYGR